MAIGLVCVGGAIVMAGAGALDPGGQAGAGSASGPPSSSTVSATATRGTAGSDPPVLEGGSTALTRSDTWSLVVILPADAPRARDSSLVVYREDEAVRELPLRRADRMRVQRLPLRRGENPFSVAISAAAGEGPRSATLVVTRDDVAPDLRIAEPSDNAVVNAPVAQLTGWSEAAATIRATNDTSDHAVAVPVQEDGSFSASVPLDPGLNEITVAATDAAGNRTQTSMSLTRGKGEPEARLTLSAASFRLRQLPAAISMRARFVDADGQPIDGNVVFSLSPPGLATTTYGTATSLGEASWQVTLPRAGASAGAGYATAQLTLPDGSTMEALASFTFE